MANIKIVDIDISGLTLFSDSESFIKDLHETDMKNIEGGLWTPSVTTTIFWYLV